jgi:hypothetical protein
MTNEIGETVLSRLREMPKGSTLFFVLESKVMREDMFEVRAEDDDTVSWRVIHVESDDDRDGAHVATITSRRYTDRDDMSDTIAMWQEGTVGVKVVDAEAYDAVLDHVRAQTSAMHDTWMVMHDLFGDEIKLG